MKKEEFAHVYGEYHEMVLHLAYDVLQDYELAWYICLEVFVKFYRKMKRMDRDCVKGWLLRYGRKRAVSLKKNPRRKKEAVRAIERLEKELDSKYWFRN